MAQQKTDTNQSQAGHIPGWLAILIVIVLAVVAWLIIIAVSERTTDSSAQNEAQMLAEDLAEPELIRSYVGTITALEESALTLDVPASRNPIERDISVRVMANEQTRLTQVSIPRQLSSDGTAAFSRIQIGFADLQVGDDVAVKSTTDITGLAEFVASGIDVNKVN